MSLERINPPDLPTPLTNSQVVVATDRVFSVTFGELADQLLPAAA
jgi:hypothetical protein